MSSLGKVYTIQETGIPLVRKAGLGVESGESLSYTRNRNPTCEESGIRCRVWGKSILYKKHDNMHIICTALVGI